VRSDYKLLGIDLCTSPSEPEAVFDKSNICESLEFEEDKMMGISEEYVAEMMKEVYEIYVAEENFKGSLEDFKKENGDYVKAVLLVEGGKFKTEEEALSHLNVEDKQTVVEKLSEQERKSRTWSYYEEAVAGGFRGSFDEWKKESPKLVEMASKVIKIAEKKKETKESFKAKISWSEAQASGFSGTIAEYKKAYPHMELVLPVPPQKKVVETIDEEAQRIFEGLKRDNPKSSVKIEHVRNMLEKEKEDKIDERLRRKAIATVGRECDGSVSQAQLERMVEEEYEALKSEQAGKRRKNWQAYRKLLEE
jgi:hypothetical protein